MYKNVSYNFSGKRALVTGGARGIGRCIALGLLKSGAETFVLDINKEGLEKLKSEHPSIQTVCVDLSDWDAARKAVQALTPIDLLVNDAAVLSIEGILESQEKTYDKVFSVNTKAPINLSQVIAKDLIARNRPGSIVNISSQGSLLPVTFSTPYCVAKGGLNVVTKALAKELGQYQIRVNAVLPTAVNTDMGKDAGVQEKLAENDEMMKIAARIPLQRVAEVEDIAGPVLFLLSDAASMVTGHLMLVDGGFCVS